MPAVGDNYALLTAIVGAGTAAITLMQWHHYRLVERAYVSMSHKPPGLIVTPKNADKIDVSVDMQLQNHGNTPARITFCLMQLHFTLTDGELSYDPEYRPEAGLRPIHSIIMKGETLNLFGNWEVERRGLQDVLDPNTPTKLFLVGYVDYIDRFGKRHRCGYARQFNSQGGITGNNLPFVTQPRYNYDHERYSGEGDDWGSEYE